MELGPENERSYINKTKSGLKFDLDKGKVIVIEHGRYGFWRQSRFQDRLNDLRDAQQELNQDLQDDE